MCITTAGLFISFKLMLFSFLSPIKIEYTKYYNEFVNYLVIIWPYQFEFKIPGYNGLVF